MNDIIERIINFKTPRQVIKLADFLGDFIYDNSTIYKKIYTNLYNSNKLENVNITSICGEVIEDMLIPRLLGFYYNKSTKLVILDFVNPDSLGEDIKNFIVDIFTKHSVDVRNYRTTMIPGKRIWFKLVDIEKIISEISKEKFELHTSTKKYNL